MLCWAEELNACVQRRDATGFRNAIAGQSLHAIFSFLLSEDALLRTPLHHAVMNNSPQIVRTIFEFTRGTPCHSAIRRLIRMQRHNRATALDDALADPTRVRIAAEILLALRRAGAKGDPVDHDHSYQEPVSIRPRALMTAAINNNTRGLRLLLHFIGKELVALLGRGFRQCDLLSYDPIAVTASHVGATVSATIEFPTGGNVLQRLLLLTKPVESQLPKERFARAAMRACAFVEWDTFDQIMASLCDVVEGTAERASAVKLLKHKDDDKRTVFHYAILMQNARVLDALLRVAAEVSNLADVLKLKDNRSRTAVHLAVELGSEAMLRMLLTALRHRRDRSPKRPRACDLVERILSIGDHQGRTALHLAAELNGASTLVALVEACGSLDFLSVRDKNGDTALHTATARHDRASVAAMLEAAGPAVGSKLVKMRNHKGRTALHLSIDRPRLHHSTDRKELCEITRGLMDAGDFALLAARDDSGRTALSLALERFIDGPLLDRAKGESRALEAQLSLHRWCPWPLVFEFWHPVVDALCSDFPCSPRSCVLRSFRVL